MSWSNSLDLQVLGGVTSELQDLSGQVLEDSSAVDCWGSSNSAVGRDSALEESVDSSDWELNSKRRCYKKYSYSKTDAASTVTDGTGQNKQIQASQKLTLAYCPQMDIETYLKSSSGWSWLWCSLWLSGSELASFAAFTAFSCLNYKNGKDWFWGRFWPDSNSEVPHDRHQANFVTEADKSVPIRRWLTMCLSILIMCKKEVYF